MLPADFWPIGGHVFPDWFRGIHLACQSQIHECFLMAQGRSRPFQACTRTSRHIPTSSWKKYRQNIINIKCLFSLYLVSTNQKGYPPETAAYAVNMDSSCSKHGFQGHTLQVSEALIKSSRILSHCFKSVHGSINRKPQMGQTSARLRRWGGRRKEMGSECVRSRGTRRPPAAIGSARLVVECESIIIQRDNCTQPSPPDGWLCGQSGERRSVWMKHQK